MIKIEKRKSKKLIAALILVFIITTIILGVLYIPYLRVKNVVEQKYPTADKTKTYIKDTGLFRPEVVVFIKQDNGDATANFVRLERDKLFGWKIKSQSTKTVATDQSLPKKEKEKKGDENLRKLAEDVKNGKIVEGDNIDIQKAREIDKKILADNDAKYQEGASLYSMNDSLDKNNAEVVYGPGSVGTRLKLNGKEVPGIQNVVSAAFSTDDKYIYYSKYNLIPENNEDGGGDGHDVFTGKIFRVDVATLKEEEVFSFGEGPQVSMRATDKYVLYALNTGEVGRIDLVTKEKKIATTLKMLDHSDTSAVVSIDERFGLIDPNDEDKIANNNQRKLQVNLETLEVEYTNTTDQE